jgi:hypothetical protein
MWVRVFVARGFEKARAFIDLVHRALHYAKIGHEFPLA